MPFIDRQGAKLYYHETGSGTPVVRISGSSPQTTVPESLGSPTAKGRLSRSAGRQ